MKKATHIRNALSCAVLAFLAGCGGSSGGNVGAGVPDTGNGSFQLKLNTASSVTLNAGDAIQFPGTAVSFPEPMKSLVWTVASTNGAPALTLANADCAVAAKKSQATATEGKVTEDWVCAAGITAPASIVADAQYVLTLTATDKVGNSATSKTQVTVRPTSGVTGAPVASTSVPAAAIAGTTVTATCAGSQGYAAKAGVYSFQWVSSPALPFATPAQASTTFVAPKVTAMQDYVITCRVTDDNQKTATSSGTIKVSPPAAPTIVPAVTAGRSVKANETVLLDGSSTTWVDSYGAPISQPIFYNWTQIAGPAVPMFNAATPQASVTMPSSVSARTTFGFTMQTSDKPFNAGATSGTVISSADVIYFMDANPHLALSTTFKDAVDSGAYVTVPLVATATPATTLPLYYSWTQVSGEAVVLGGSTTSTLNFGAPVNMSTTDPKILLFRAAVGYSPITVAEPGVAVLDVVVVVNPTKPAQ